MLIQYASKVAKSDFRLARVSEVHPDVHGTVRQGCIISTAAAVVLQGSFYYFEGRVDKFCSLRLLF